MGNPWAPPDNSPSPGGPASEQQAPPAPGAPAPAPQDAPPPAPHGADRPPAGPVPHPAPGAPGPHPVRPPDPAGVASASRTAAWTAATLLVSVLLVSAPWPAMLVAPAAAVAGLVLGIVAVVRAARAHGRGSVVALPVVLVVASLVWVGISAQTLLYVDATRDYARCESAALTQQAQRGCAVQLEDDMRERLESLLGRVGVPSPS
ncbi:hypothetical protein J4038_09790 [Cellulomonas sp. zg-ZUI40]|nr:hypothetical protein [Cellulomonas dongxiuzhuiae]